VVASSQREDIMKRERIEYRKPYGRGDYELHRGGEGVYWRAGNGLSVRIAAAEHVTEDARAAHAGDLSAGEAASLEGWSTELAR
jgi:hypothetical protein